DVFFPRFGLRLDHGGLGPRLHYAAQGGVGLAVVGQVIPNMTGGGDPTYFGAIIAGITSLIFAILAWVIPARAAAIAGRGVSLAVHGGTIVSGSIVAAQGAGGRHRPGRAGAAPGKGKNGQVVARARAAQEEG